MRRVRYLRVDLESAELQIQDTSLVRRERAAPWQGARCEIIPASRRPSVFDHASRGRVSAACGRLNRNLRGQGSRTQATRSGSTGWNYLVSAAGNAASRGLVAGGGAGDARGLSAANVGRARGLPSDRAG